MPEPKEYDSESDWMEVCVPKMMGEGKDNDQAVAACMSMWKDKDKPQEAQAGFSFTELSNTDAKPIDGLIAGHPFVSLSGDVIQFKVEDLEAYVANTQAVIDSTKTEKGEVVGLPIDKDSHDHKGGAGWIVGLELDKTRNVIKFLVNWTQEGVDLIKNNIRRFFSPSVDVTHKVILGGSMTNWPASRTKQGQILLRPVELSQTVKEIDMEKTLEDVLLELDALKTKNAELEKKVTALSSKPKDPDDDSRITPEMADFIANTPGAEELGKQAQELAMRTIKDAQRKEHVKEFAARVVGGTPERPFGIPVKSSAIVAALLSMPDKQREFMENLILRLYEGAIDFAEHGINASEFVQGKKVPAEFRNPLKLWVESGNTAASWFTEIGKDFGMNDPKDYDLREFAALEQKES